MIGKNHNDVKSRIDIEPGLVHRVRSGDARAYGELVDVLMKPAYYHALALTGRHDDAVDVVQQAFIRAWDARSVTDPARPYYPWFYTILKRLCLNVLRSHNRSRETAQSMLPAWIEPAGSEDASTDILRAEQSRLLQEALARLDPDRRRAGTAAVRRMDGAVGTADRPGDRLVGPDSHSRGRCRNHHPYDLTDPGKSVSP
ncbi:RNA polymerase sigma factor [Balneolales bacterium ANBcel1]|nr:RNA polymerase sigma factor [Balneolales bacterium ANBcel1]